MAKGISLREKFLWFLSAVLLLMFVFTERDVPQVIAREEAASFKTDEYQELKTFTDVLSIVKRDYVDEVETKKVVQGAIRGMLAALDPHSGYLNPDYYKDLRVQTKGEFGGLGIEITVRDGLLVVVAPMEGTPAAKAGIQPGDAIVKIEGKFTKDITLIEAVEKLRGPRGEPITISIHREGNSELIDVTVIRDVIKVKSVRKRYLEDGFGYIRISQFMENTADDIIASLDYLKEKAGKGKFRGLVLDMRNNPGGLLTQAVRVTDFFINEGVIVYTKGRVEGQQQKFYAHDRGTEPDYPIVVLVNGGSASAAEIVSGALKDHGRALILGTQSFGKGSVQTITPLSNGGAVSLTTALYYTKSGNSIQARGVTPDIEIEMDNPVLVKGGIKKDLRSSVRESDLPGAIKNPDGNGDDSALRHINKVPVVDPQMSRINLETEDLKEWFNNDIQLFRAFEILKSFDVFKSIRDENSSRKEDSDV